MSDTSIILRNNNGGYYVEGKPFSKAKWVSIVDVYDHELVTHGSCSIHRLAELAHISRYSAHKAIDYYDFSMIVPNT